MGKDLNLTEPLKREKKRTEEVLQVCAGSWKWEELHRLLGCEKVGVYLLKKRGILTLIKNVGEGELPKAVPLGQPTVGETALNKQPRVLRLERDLTHEVVSVPLVENERCVGVVEFYGVKTPVFSSTLLAYQALGSLIWERLKGEMKENEAAKILQQARQTIKSSYSMLTEVSRTQLHPSAEEDSKSLKRAKASLKELLSCDEVGMFVVAENRAELVEVTKKIKVPLGEGITGKCAWDGKVMFFKDISDAEGIFTKYYDSIPYDVPPRSFLAVPLKLNKEVLGVLTLIYQRPKEILEREEKFVLETVASALSVSIKNSRLYGTLKELFTQFLTAIINALDARDHYTQGHSRRVATYSRQLAKKLRLKEWQIKNVFLGGLLHDIGKIGVRDSILNKPGRLTDEEFEELKNHTIKGYNILKSIEHLSDVLPMVRHHHERWDGKGYPDGLKEDELPIETYIVSVCDAYDAMTSDRSYRKRLPLEVVIKELKANAGKQFHPAVAKAMVEAIENGEIREEEEDLRSLTPVSF